VIGYSAFKDKDSCPRTIDLQSAQVLDGNTFQGLTTQEAYVQQRARPGKQQAKGYGRWWREPFPGFPGKDPVLRRYQERRRTHKDILNTQSLLSSKASRVDGSNHGNTMTCHSRATFGLHIACFAIVWDLLNPNVSGSLYVNVTFASRRSILLGKSLPRWIYIY
jgi:hypothetical protein